MTGKKIIVAGALCAGLAGAMAAQAQEPAAAQAVFIEADHVVIDEKARTSTYTGNVALSRGGMKLESERMTVQAAEKRIGKVIAEGAPVRMTQQATAQAPETRATAQRIEYDVQTEQLLLVGAAQFRQGTNQFSGSRIEYDARRNIVSASKAPDSSERVKVIIYPPEATPEPAAGGAREPSP